MTQHYFENLFQAITLTLKQLGIGFEEYFAFDENDQKTLKVIFNAGMKKEALNFDIHATPPETATKNHVLEMGATITTDSHFMTALEVAQGMNKLNKTPEEYKTKVKLEAFLTPHNSLIDLECDIYDDFLEWISPDSVTPEMTNEPLQIEWRSLSIHNDMDLTKVYNGIVGSLLLYTSSRLNPLDLNESITQKMSQVISYEDALRINYITPHR